MANCKNCSAPLLANTNLCDYCGVRNDVDLHAKHDFTVHKQTSKRDCPHCEQSLQTIHIQLAEDLFVDRCAECFGLFFDLGELERLLNHSVQQVHAINLTHLDNINTDRFQAKQVVRYIKCPECHEFMRRTNFAKKSGVIVDICRAHGIWLDSGEVTHLMEWKKMGGQLLHEKEQERKTPVHNIHKNTESPSSAWEMPERQETLGLESDLLDVMSFIARKIF